MLKVGIKKRLGRRGSGDGIAVVDFLLDIEFNAPPGFTILFGPSGSGKTVTLKSIAGMIRPDSGRITVGEVPLFDSDRGIDLPIRKRGIGYVFQNLALFPHKTALDNVEFGMSGLSAGDRRRKAMEMMSALRIEHVAPRKPKAISGGEAQRVALARALTSQPRILLLDEPLSAIDESTKLGIISDLKSLNRELGLPIVYVTHSREEAVTLGESVIVYERGRIVALGEPLQVLGSPATVSVARLSGAENILQGRIVSNNEAGGTLTAEVKDTTGVCRLEVPFGAKAVGDSIKLAVLSGDIMLATRQPRNTSARNILRGHIRAIEDRSNRTVIQVESGVMWSVSVTRQAVKDLSLNVGQLVWLAIKTHSCYVLDE